MRIIILFLLTILTVNNTIAQQPTKQQPTKEQAEIQKKLNERLLKDQKEAQEKESKNKNKTNVGVKWTGTMTSETIIIHSNAAYNGKVEIHGTASFADALPTMYRDIETTDLNFTDDKGVGSHIVNSEITDMTGKKCVGACNGNGKAELHAVVINEESNTYDIEVIFPGCVGTGDCKDDGVYKADDLEAIVSDYPLGTNKDVLSGSKKVTAELPGGLGTVTSTTTWNLVRSKPLDVELIVKPEETPAGYEKWVPTPGRDELSKGSVMTINLKLQGKNGKPLTVKAESFELTLSNTSKEPGITINYPVEPDAKQLPDLRFILLPGIESIDDDQFITVGSPDGTTGKALIASYDGGGWATLTVEAILEDKRRIKGQLFVSGGEEDILIPKRTPGTKIALAWSKTNGNPGDMDDKETSKSNNNNGDGLTAYEEYRGVISRRKFKRLNPKKKELGIRVEKNEFPVFEEGIGWFSNASDVDTVIFNSNEIGFDGRLNKNFASAHDFDQCVLILKKAPLPTLVGGKAYTSTDAPALPDQTLEVDIDVDQIHTSIYQYLINLFGPLTYSSSELISATVAHELAHGVNVAHHGELEEIHSPQDVTTDEAYVNYQIFDKYGHIISTRPYHMHGPIGVKGNEASGDLSCVRAYNPYFKWAYHEENGFKFFYEVPLIPIGRQMCNSRVGTGINAPAANPGTNSNKYFAKASVGNCINQIKLR
ncbi:MAG TPA: hypothetical protein VKB95_07490 [Chitinophagaceae bacterium]|nr:hypothetical protein [Chitinophagaceae bacterium]